MKKYLFLSLLVLVTLACNESNNQAPFEERLMTKAEIQEFQTELDGLFIRSGFKDYQYSELDHSATPTFDKIDEQYRSFITANKNHKYLYAFRKRAATFIINQYGLTKPSVAKDFDALAFYTKEMGNGSFEDCAVLMTECLSTLNGHWPKTDTAFYLDLSKKELEKRQKSVDRYIKQSENFIGNEKNVKSPFFEPSKELLKGLREEKIALVLEIQKNQNIIPVENRL